MRGRVGWALGSGIVAMAIVAALSAGGALDATAPCATADRRLGVAHGPEGWTAEARHQRWHDGARCRGRVRVALFAPGDTWEDEALAPAALLEAPAAPRPPPDARLRWTGDRIALDGADPLAFEVRRLPRGDDPGAFRFRPGGDPVAGY
ncbi:MAG TPA: hypothetical protein RMH99_12005 [Sandaracinaceae bacterium LLY-WYZ-13_1]|nr:hypothetical protein [Sandaracinaceae bacterium LLY-WYZ-13_1]